MQTYIRYCDNEECGHKEIVTIDESGKEKVCYSTNLHSKPCEAIAKALFSNGDADAFFPYRATLFLS